MGSQQHPALLEGRDDLTVSASQAGAPKAVRQQGNPRHADSKVPQCSVLR